MLRTFEYFDVTRVTFWNSHSLGIKSAAALHGCDHRACSPFKSDGQL